MNRLWWLGNVRYFFYFLRECTGPVIVLYTLYFLVQWYRDPSFSFVSSIDFRVISWVGLLAALLHSLTWFFVSARIFTGGRSILEKIVFLLLIAVWVVLSFGLLTFFYQIPNA